MPELCRSLRRENVIIYFAIEFDPWRAERTLSGIISVDVAALRILNPCQAGQMLHESDKPLFLLTHLLLSPSSLDHDGGLVSSDT